VVPQTDAVRKKPVNEVLADALSFFMGSRWNQSSLGKAAGVAPNTVKHYLQPGARVSGDRGKAPSAKLTELEKIASALGLRGGRPGHGHDGRRARRSVPSPCWPPRSSSAPPLISPPSAGFFTLRVGISQSFA